MAMATVHLVLIILALVCFLFAALDVKGTRVNVTSVNLTAAGLFLWLLSTLITR